MKPLGLLTIIFAFTSCKSTNKTATSNDGTLAAAATNSVTYKYYCTNNNKPIIEFLVVPVPNKTAPKEQWKITSIKSHVNEGSDKQQWWECKLTNGLENGVIPSSGKNYPLNGFRCEYPSWHSFTIKSGSFPVASNRKSMPGNLKGSGQFGLNGIDLMCESWVDSSAD